MGHSVIQKMSRMYWKICSYALVIVKPVITWFLSFKPVIIWFLHFFVKIQRILQKRSIDCLNYKDVWLINVIIFHPHTTHLVELTMRVIILLQVFVLTVAWLFDSNYRYIYGKSEIISSCFRKMNTWKFGFTRSECLTRKHH